MESNTQEFTKYTIYKNKISRNSSFHKYLPFKFSYETIDNKDLMGDPITSYEKDIYKWWDCKLFDKKHSDLKN